MSTASELVRFTAAELAAKIAAKEVSSTEVTQACLDQIDRTDGEYHAFLHVSADQALTAAADIDAKVAAGDELPSALAGVPLAVIQAAQHKLQELEQSPLAKKAKNKPAPLQAGLFSEPLVIEKIVEKARASPVETALQALDIDSLTPRAALQHLYELQALLMKHGEIKA